MCHSLCAPRRRWHFRLWENSARKVITSNTPQCRYDTWFRVTSLRVDIPHDVTRVKSALHILVRLALVLELQQQLCMTAICTSSRSQSLSASPSRPFRFRVPLGLFVSPAFSRSEPGGRRRDAAAGMLLPRRPGSPPGHMLMASAPHTRCACRGVDQQLEISNATLRSSRPRKQAELHGTALSNMALAFLDFLGHLNNSRLSQTAKPGNTSPTTTTKRNESHDSRPSWALRQCRIACWPSWSKRFVSSIAGLDAQVTTNEKSKAEKRYVSLSLSLPLS